ncbi:MAG TPA: SDR family NAD(P)-dependent oxidoreductase [Chryseolinea sp.]
MKLQHQTILITGGSSGIGLELAKQLVAKENTLLICGRSQERLDEAKAIIPSLYTFRCDLSKEDDRIKLFEWVITSHPACNVLINNAAMVHKTSFLSDPEIIKKATHEVDTNLIAPIVLTKLFLSRFEQNQESAVINITTGLIYAPRAVYPIYNATKAALHAFTQVLRHQLMKLPIEVIEVMMPAVDTPWHKGDVPKIAIPPVKAVNEMVRKVEKGEKEIRIGGVALLYMLSRIAPALAFRKINQLS